MRILTRYVFREFLVPLCYCLGGFLAIYVLFELFGSFSRLAEAELPFATVAEYFCAYLAPYFEWLAPAALMLATLYTMWNFCRHSELIAMRANGIGFFTIVKPLLAAALLMALFVTWVNECYVPRRAQWAKQLKTAKFDPGKMASTSGMVYRNARGNRIWTIGALEDVEARRLSDVRISFDREGGVRVRNVFAERAEYLDGEWWLTNAKAQHFDVRGQEIASPTPELDAVAFRPFPELNERPDDFLAQNRDWAYNSVRDKLRYVRTHPDLSEADRRSHLYDAWAQIMAPWACLVITLFAIPAGIATGRQSVFRGILGAIALFFAFYALTIGCMTAQKKGWLPPIPAAVLPDAVFLIVGIRSFHKQR